MAPNIIKINGLKTEIIDVFKANVYPGDSQLLGNGCYDDMGIKAFYGKKVWKDIPDELIVYENGLYAAIDYWEKENRF